MTNKVTPHQNPRVIVTCYKISFTELHLLDCFVVVICNVSSPYIASPLVLVVQPSYNREPAIAAVKARLA